MWSYLWDGLNFEYRVFMQLFGKILSGLLMANSVDPDQTAPKGAV